MSDPSLPPSLQPSLHEQLRQRVPTLSVTPFLIAANVLVFLAMLRSGAALWHSPNGVQLAWGANFGPATQDGEWWRLASAMFLHFGVLHLAMNMLALWDSGRLVERMLGPGRFAVLYLLCGVSGNLLSLVAHQGKAVSGGASGAIFGVFGALMIGLWRERERLDPREFRWMFWGAAAFAAVTIGFGFVIDGIDNAAHLGGFVSGALVAVFLAPALPVPAAPRRVLRSVAALVWGAAVAVLVVLIPPPAYRWHDELQAREEISEFLKEEAAIGQTWQSLVRQGQLGVVSPGELATRIEEDIGDRYADSFEQLSRMPIDPALPSAAKLENLRRYAQSRRDASRSLAETLRRRDAEAQGGSLYEQGREEQGAVAAGAPASTASSR